MNKKWYEPLPLSLEEWETMVDLERPSPLNEPIPEDYRALGLYWIARLRVEHEQRCNKE